MNSNRQPSPDYRGSLINQIRENNQKEPPKKEVVDTSRPYRLKDYAVANLFERQHQLAEIGYQTRNWYNFLQPIIDTFAGMFRLKEEIDCLPFLIIQNEFFRQAFINPEIYLYYNDLTDAFFIFSKNGPNEYHDLINEVNISLPDDYLVKFNWGTNQFRYFDWVLLAKQMIKLEQAFLTNSMFDTKKILRKLNNNNEELNQAELANVLSPNTPFIDVNAANFFNGSDIGNTYTELNLGSSKASSAINNILDWFNWRANFLGWITTQQQKMERKTFAEGQIDVNNTILLQQLTLTNLKVLSAQILEKWGIALAFELTRPLDNKSLSDNQPDQEQTDFFAPRDDE